MRAAFVNKLAPFAAVVPAVLSAADLWDSKPFQDWTDKDVQKLVSNSPWARQARAVLADTTFIAAGRNRNIGG